jgi:hypothetical protein
MPLNFIKAHVPMAGGLAEDMDERIVVAAGGEARLLEARNLVWDKRGRIAKRHGFTAVTSLDSDGDPLPFGTRGIFSTGIELCVLGPRQLYSYVPQHDRWYDRGQLGPADGRTREIYHSQTSYTCPDLATQDGFVLYVARTGYQAIPGGTGYADVNMVYSIVQSVQTVDEVSVITPTEQQSYAGDNVNVTHSPRACNVPGRLFGLWLSGTVSPGKIWRSDYLTATPATPPAAAVTMYSDVYLDGFNRRTYDAIKFEVAAGWLLAYIRSTDRAVVIYRYSNDHVVQAAGVIAGPWYRVAVADSPTLAQVYLLLVRDNGAAPDDVYYYVLDRAGLGVISGAPMVNGDLDTADDRVMNLGLVQNGSWVHCIWDFERGNNPRQSVIRHNNSSTAGGPGVARPPIYNATIRSRPWVHTERTYCWLDTAVAGADDNDETVLFFEAAFAVDLLTDDTGPIFLQQNQPKLAGVHSVGAIPPHGNVIGSGLEMRRYARQNGSAGTVIKIGTNEYRYASTRLGEVAQDTRPRLTSDEVSLEFGGLPLATKVHEGAAVIGGSFFAWFAGSQTEELSFVTPPIVEDKNTILAFPRDEASTAGSIPNGVYSYQARWATSDARGNVHRGLPSNIVQHTKAGLQAVRLAIRTCPASLRFPLIAAGRESVAIVHRAGADAIFKRMSPPVERTVNEPDAHIVELLDHGQLFDPATGSGTGAPIYTTGGEVEAVCPEGGQILAVAGDRLWISDLYRRERVQFSKRLTPATGTQDVLAPEFSELFGFVVPSGRPVTGIGDLDSSVAIFTDQEIYVISGNGPDDAGNGNDFSGLVPVASDTGCLSPRSVVSCPFGVLFQGDAGIYLLDRTLQLSFVGRPVQDTLQQYPSITSAVLVSRPRTTEVRFTCNQGDDLGVILVWQYDTKQWSIWDVTTAGPNTPFAGACVHQGVYYVVDFQGHVYREDTATWLDNGDSWIYFAGRTAWLQGAGQSGWQRTRSCTLLQASKDPHELTVEVYADFEETPAQSHTWASAELAAFPGHPRRQQVRVGIGRQKGQAHSVAWADGPADDSVTGESYTMAGLTFELGIKRGTVKVAKGQRS